MSVDVLHLAINFIQSQENDQLKAHFRQALVPVSAEVAHLIEQLHLAYNGKPAKGYASFHPEQQSRLAEPLERWQQQELSYLQLAEHATQELVLQLVQHQIPESGYFVFCHYRYLASEYLLVTLLGSKDHFSVTADLQLSTDRHLDIARMQLAARLDLTEYQSSPEQQKYISFIRGRAGRKVADFFLDFLGCEEGIVAKDQSKMVLASVEEYLAASDYDASEKTDVRKQVYQYCEEQAKAGLDVHLDELSSTIDSNDARAFSHYCAEQNIAVPEQFPVDVKELKTLVKFAGSGGGVSISFEQKHLGERVKYDMDRDLLIIQGVPPNLKDQLQRFLKGFSSFDRQTDET
ncbi:nucleoid-associated protein YejK [Rheinheimera sp.]|uniref:nucleoid-associated protein YejK n=1 Tax=Rheinheimera sp. TaxID=1869214 RepID=UPI00307D0AF5